MVEHFDRTLVISEVDRAAIRDEPSERFFECPHGVTLDDAPARADDRDPDSIVFSGNMNYRPNVDAALFFVREMRPPESTQSGSIRRSADHRSILLVHYIPFVN